MNILKVEVRAFVHATEELDAVVSCLDAILQDFDYSVERTYSHFNNPIDLITARYKRKKASLLFETIVSKMYDADRKKILNEIEDRFDGKLHIRLDKMKACSGELSIGVGIDFAITVTSYPFDRNKIIEELKDSFQK